MHEWLSGGVSPCQGEGRGFESRLALIFLPENPVMDFRAFFDRRFVRVECFAGGIDVRGDN